jgi:hypothetical protein
VGRTLSLAEEAYKRYYYTLRSCKRGSFHRWEKPYEWIKEYRIWKRVCVECGTIEIYNPAEGCVLMRKSKIVAFYGSLRQRLNDEGYFDSFESRN